MRPESGRSIHIKYRIKDLKRFRKKYKPGMRLMVIQLREDGEEYSAPKRQRFTVVRPFPHHVSCIDEHGFRRSFTYVDLEEQATIIR